MIQLKGDGTSPANTRRFEVSPTRKSTHRKHGKDLRMCQYLHWPQRCKLPLSGGQMAANLLAPAVIMPLRTLAKRCKRFTPLLAAPAALLLIQGEAKAILTYNIFESAGNVVVQTSGSLDLTGATSIGTTSCGGNGFIRSSSATICTGPDLLSPYFTITGPSSFNGSAVIGPASSVTGLTTLLNGLSNFFLLTLHIPPTLQSSAVPRSMAQPSLASVSPQQV